MKNKSSKLINEYIKEVARVLPIKGKNERAFLNDLRAGLTDFIEEFPQSSRADVEDRFGAPQKVAYDYLSMLDYRTLKRRLILARLVKAVCFIIVIVCIITTVKKVSDLTKTYIDFKEEFEGGYFIEEVIR